MAHCRADRDIRAELALQVDVEGRVMAALVDRRRWRVAREALDARCGDAAGLVADDDGGVVGAAVLV